MVLGLFYDKGYAFIKNNRMISSVGNITRFLAEFVILAVKTRCCKPLYLP